MSGIYKVIKFNLHEKWYKLIGEEPDVCCLFMEWYSILFHDGFNNDYDRNHKPPRRRSPDSYRERHAPTRLEK